MNIGLPKEFFNTNNKINPGLGEYAKLHAIAKPHGSVINSQIYKESKIDKQYSGGMNISQSDRSNESLGEGQLSHNILLLNSQDLSYGQIT